MVATITDQEIFWAGEFGDQYIDRNQGEALLASNLALFSRILELTGRLQSIIEFGANIGMNLMALRQLQPRCELAGVEINAKAAERLRALPGVRVYEQSLYGFKVDEPRDLAFTKGVLIHLKSEKLPETYDLLYRASRRFVCVAEYYNPAPVEVPYRGHQGKLFKRDFAGDLMARHKDLKLAGYGFVYHGDTQFPQDDLTWFLLEKRK
jgi:pseudaminic acid biosynthesis-associated methylase